jgi:outer membrane protein
MKKFLLIAAFAAFSTLAAQAEVKIATIDLRKVFDGYYKTKQADANLKDEAADKEKERKEMVDNFRKGEDEYKKLLEKSNDQAVSGEERDKAKSAAEKKLLELKELEQTVQTFERSARAALGEKQRRKRDVILEEIRAAINAKAKLNSYTMVVDTAAESVNNTPIVLFTNGENSLTDEILKELNATASPGVLKSLEEREKKDAADKKEAPKTEEKK